MGRHPLLLALVLAGCGTAGLLPESTASTLPAPEAVAARGRASVAPFAYFNRSSGQWNKCGQAAAATLLDHARLNPLDLPLTTWSGADRRNHPDNDAFVDGLADRYPPDIAFGLAGSSPALMVRMLQETGMRAQVSSGQTGDLTGLRRWVNAGWPVAVLVDADVLWGKTFILHWSVVHAVDSTTVRIANPMAGDGVVSADTFYRAWGTHGSPVHHVQVAAER